MQHNIFFSQLEMMKSNSNSLFYKIYIIFHYIIFFHCKRAYTIPSRHLRITYICFSVPMRKMFQFNFFKISSIFHISIIYKPVFRLKNIPQIQFFFLKEFGENTWIFIIKTWNLDKFQNLRFIFLVENTHWEHF